MRIPGSLVVSHHFRQYALFVIMMQNVVVNFALSFTDNMILDIYDRFVLKYLATNYYWEQELATWKLR